MPTRTQVVIVGGGPVGVALAVDLAQRGISSIVVERHEEVGRIPKGQNLMHRTLEHFYYWGCVDELRAARTLPQGYPIGGVTAYRSLMDEHWYIPEGLNPVGPYYFQANERLPQYRTEEVLRARAAELPLATIRFNTSARSIEQDADAVRVTVVGEEWPYEEEVIEADYLVGCDGARSQVREQAGIGLVGRDFDEKMLLAVFRSRELHQGLERFPERTTYRVLDPRMKGVWLFFGRVDLGESWFFHGPVPRESTPHDTEVFLELMHHAAGFPFACEFDHIGFWELAVSVATTYQNGRILIAGDACHSHPPYGGLGLNSGLDDVTNLGWKLSATLQGWGGPTLLDTYSTERQPIFKQTGEDVIGAWIDEEREFLERYSPERDPAEFERMWRGRTGGETAPAWYEPHYEGSPLVSGAASDTIGIHGEHRFEARAGHHLAPALLSSGRNVFEVLGSAFSLLAFATHDTTVDAFVKEAGELGMPLEVVRDTAEDERARYGARLVLVRPDQYVAWCGDEPPADVRAVLATAIGRS